MKSLISGVSVLLLFACALSCRKTSFIQSADALVNTSADTLHFDTVFTTTGSITKSFKIFNRNDQKLRLSNVKLMGAASSAFKLNVDGTAGVDFNNIEIAPNDSIYVFVSVTISQNSARLPYIVQDSILINYNGNNKYVQLDAFGQNANFLRNSRITRNTTWINNDLPYVILGSVLIDSGASLTINKGCRIFVHADAPIIVNGSLKVNGERFDSTRVVFRGDRLDEPYRNFPGSWPGIYFSPSSKDNLLNYAIIENAYQGIITEFPSSDRNYKVSLNQCIIDNIYDAGILSIASSVKATNCLISNCGSNIAITAGGSYDFNYCTVVSYSNSYLTHKSPVMLVSNADNQNQLNNLSAVFRNCIFWGEGGIVDNEVVIDKKVTSSSVAFENILYKGKEKLSTAVNSILNEPPQFDSIDAGKRYFDFHLQ
ncbi:MAG: hypothetical protein WKF91_10650, partial [Segetibacter sp.]